MKTVQSKILLTLIIIFFIVGFTTSAKSIIDFPHSLFASEPVPESGEINPLSVIYPVCLKENRLQTKEYVKTFSENKRDYIIHIFSKGKKFFPKAIEVFSKYAVPVELQMIPVLESEFNSKAISPVGAVGYWQFMKELANEYGLHTGKNDDRKNFTKSTVAAAKFFRDQLDFFNDDILLAVASYNCGQGRVISSIKKSGKADANFWNIKRYLPLETRKFVMNFIAFNVIAANYDKFLNKQLDFAAAPYMPNLLVADSSRINDSLHIKLL